MKHFALMASIISIAAYVLTGQVTQPRQGSPKNVSAPNAWMTTPGNLSNDDVPRTIREQRDSMWAGAIGIGASLTRENASASKARLGDYILEQAEFKSIRDEADLIATFTKSRSILTPSEDAIYTEITLHVTEVFRDVRRSLKAGDDITTMEPGGTVKTSRGSISFLTQPIEYFWQPGKTYFLRMQYHSDGDWYSMEERWDISDGIVHPDDARRAARAGRAFSSIVNLTNEQLRRAMTARFPNK